MAGAAKSIGRTSARHTIPPSNHHRSIIYQKIITPKIAPIRWHIAQKLRSIGDIRHPLILLSILTSKELKETFMWNYGDKFYFRMLLL